MRFDLILLEEVAINSTVELSSRWPTNWRTVIQRKFSHCCKSPRAHNRFSNLWIWWRDWESPVNLAWKVCCISLQNFHRTKVTDSWRAQENLMCTGTEEKGAVTPERLSLTFLWVSRSLWQRYGSTVAYNSPGSWGMLAWVLIIQWTAAFWSLVPLPFLNPACTSGSLLFRYFWNLAWRILSITLLPCEMSAIVQ